MKNKKIKNKWVKCHHCGIPNSVPTAILFPTVKKQNYAFCSIHCVVGWINENNKAPFTLKLIRKEGECHGITE